MNANGTTTSTTAQLDTNKKRGALLGLAIGMSIAIFALAALFIVGLVTASGGTMVAASANAAAAVAAWTSGVVAIRSKSRPQVLRIRARLRPPRVSAGTYAFHPVRGV